LLRLRAFQLSLIPNLFPESKSNFSYFGAGLEYYPFTRYNGLHVGGKYGIQTFRLKEIDSKIADIAPKACSNAK